MFSVQTTWSWAWGHLGTILGLSWDYLGSVLGLLDAKKSDEQATKIALSPRRNGQLEEKRCTKTPFFSKTAFSPTRNGQNRT